MKKFGLLAAALICFAGCAQNDTDEFGATDTYTNETAVGTPASTQSGIDSSMQDTNSVWDTNQGSSTLSTDTNQFNGSSLNQDTNNVGQPGASQSGSLQSTPPPPPPDQQQGSQPTP